MKVETIELNKERNVNLTTYLLDTPADYENIKRRPGRAGVARRSVYALFQPRGRRPLRWRLRQRGIMRLFCIIP